MSRAWWRSGCGARSRAIPSRSTRGPSTSRSRFRSGSRRSNSRAKPSPMFSSAPIPRYTGRHTTAATAWWRKRLERLSSPRRYGSRSAFLRNRSLSGRLLRTNADPGILKQHARGILCGARHRGVVAHQVLRDRAVDKERQLRRQMVRVGDLELHQQLAEPEPATFLESDRDVFHGLILGAKFGDRVDERATAKILARKTPLQQIEGAEDLLGRRPFGGGGMIEGPRQKKRRAQTHLSRGGWEGRVG